jgi:hypothetical protein
MYEPTTASKHVHNVGIARLSAAQVSPLGDVCEAVVLPGALVTQTCFRLSLHIT